MDEADSASDLNLSSDSMVRQLHDLLARNSFSVSLAADSSDSGDGLEETDLHRRILSTGWPQLDAILPEGGLRQGMLLECLGALQGGGVALLGLWFAWQMLSLKSSVLTEIQAKVKGNQKQQLQGANNQEKGGVLVVFDNDRRFYPPVASALGISLDRLMIVVPESKKDLYWALEQVLRCPAVGAVWSCMSKVSSRDFRRLQLAAEAGRALGVLVRERKFERTPTWAHVRLQVSALPVRGAGLNRSSEILGCSQEKESDANLFDVGDWRFQIKRRRAVSAMVGNVMRTSECEVDLREVMETSGQGQSSHLEQSGSMSELQVTRYPTRQNI